VRFGRSEGGEPVETYTVARTSICAATTNAPTVARDARPRRTITGAPLRASVVGFISVAVARTNAALRIRERAVCAPGLRGVR